MVKVELCTKWSCVGAKILTLAELLAPCQALLELSATPSEVYAQPWPIIHSAPQLRQIAPLLIFSTTPLRAVLKPEVGYSLLLLKSPQAYFINASKRPLAILILQKVAPVCSFEIYVESKKPQERKRTVRFEPTTLAGTTPL